MLYFYPMKMILETGRLWLREFVEADAPELYLLNSDPKVMKYVGEPLMKSEEEALERIRNYPDYRKYGYGRWACLLKGSGEFIGWCGLKYLPEEDEVDVGYRFLVSHWGRGYATEAAIACIEFGLDKLQLKRVVAHAMVENKASERVMQKAGMRCIGKAMIDGFYTVVYEATPSADRT